MTDETTDPSLQVLAISKNAPSKPTGRLKPGPGRHGSGRLPPTLVAVVPPALSEPAAAATQISTASPQATPRLPVLAPAPTATLALAPVATNTMPRPTAKSKPARVPAKRAPDPLSLEDTISVSSALLALRGPFFIVHVETADPDPVHGHAEILAIHAVQLDGGVPVSVFSVQVQPLVPVTALPAGLELGMAIDADGEALSLQEAITRLHAFLGNRWQHVFVHGAAATQTILGRAARQYGLVIENPVGDVVDLAKLAWPGRTDYSLSGLAAELRLASRSAPEAPDATKALLGVLMVASKTLTANGGRVSSSLVHWGNSEDCVRIRMTPW